MPMIPSHLTNPGAPMTLFDAVRSDSKESNRVFCDPKYKRVTVRIKIEVARYLNQERKVKDSGVTGKERKQTRTLPGVIMIILLKVNPNTSTAI